MAEQKPNPETEQQNPGTDTQNNPPPGETVDPNSDVLARVIMQDVVEGVSYQPNTFAQFKAKVALPLEKAGRIDTSDEAVAYCKANNLEKIVHEDAKKALTAAKKKARK